MRLEASPSTMANCHDDNERDIPDPFVAQPETVEGMRQILTGLAAHNRQERIIFFFSQPLL